MSHKAFSVGVTAKILAQLQNNGIGLYCRSDEASDSYDLDIAGLNDSDAAVSEQISGNGKIEKPSANAYNYLYGAVLTQDSSTSTISLYSDGTGATGYLRAETNPANSTTLTFGLIGSTKVYTFESTLTAGDGHVKIGATATDTIDNLRRAINNAGTAGTHYGTGTGVNPYVSATNSGTIITLTDRIPCSRLLGWSFAQSSTHFSLPATLIGGVDGTLLAELDADLLAAYSAFSLSTEDLSTATWPAGLTIVSEPIRINGKACVLQFKAENVSTALPVTYQTSTDGTNWSNGQTSITSLDNNLADSPRVVVPAERSIELLRLNGSNPNTTASKIDARVIYPLV